MGFQSFVSVDELLFLQFLYFIAPIATTKNADWVDTNVMYIAGCVSSLKREINNSYGMKLI